MVSVTLVLSSKITKAGTQSILIQILHNRRKKEIATGYRVETKFWKNGAVTSKFPDYDIINAALQDMLTEYRRKALIAYVEGAESLKIENKHTMNSYLSSKVAYYKSIGKVNYSMHIRNVEDNLRSCFGGVVRFDQFTLPNIEQLHSYLVSIGNATNTVHKKFKILRQFQQSAINEGLFVGVNRFNSFQLKKQFVKKDKLSLEDIAKIEALDLGGGGELQRARDLFLFSYYCKGMRFKNCYSVQLEHIHDGRIYFPKISKSYKDISIKIHSRLAAIVDRYATDHSTGQLRTAGALFDFKHLPGSYNTICNRNLKLIASLCGIKLNLTFHISRHSFANNLKQIGTNINVIKDALGHSDVRITEVYLSSLDDEVIDGDMERLYGV